MKTEKHYYKLADYFVTIGLDNYYVPEEVYKTEEVKSRESVFGPDGIPMVSTDINSSEIIMSNSNVTSSMDQQRQSIKQELRNQVDDFKIIEDEDTGLQWHKIVKALEILVI